MANNYCHLSYEDRKNIEDGLNDNKSIYIIAKELNRSYSSIYREIDRNKVYFQPKQYGTYKINNYDRDVSCERLKKSPYVCNGCKSRSDCRKERFTYYARKADDSYREIKSEARKGINLTPEEIFEINEVITPLVKKGQTTNHLYINHPDILDFSKSSFYNYINQGIFDFGPLDFPRIVKYKKKKIQIREDQDKKEKSLLEEDMKTFANMLWKILISI